MGLFSRSKLDLALAEERGRQEAERQHAQDNPGVITMGDLAPAPMRWQAHDGEKFAGGLGAINLLVTDYWTLRARSAELFKRNLYARGVIRRLVTNEINTGLHLEATPREPVLGYEEDELADWTENTETLFELWGKTPRLCDSRERQTFGSLQATARLEALVAGDVLVMLVQDRRTQLPRIRLINGAAVQTPHGKPALRAGNKIEHGVELDGTGKHVAYWIRKPGGNPFDVQHERVSAWGPKSGRRIAWLMYGTDKRLDEVRGEPLLSLVLQSLSEIDKYRDSVQRKAVLNAMIAMFIKRTEQGPQSRLAAGGGAVRRSVGTTVDSQGTQRGFEAVDLMPGLFIDNLEPGEEPHGFMPNGTDEKFGDFERAIVQAIAWANEIPPEILLLSFGSNYAASQAAVNEFKMYLNRVRTDFSANFCQPVYEEWLLSQVLTQHIEAPGYLDAWRDFEAYDKLAAWNDADWSGAIKPSSDLTKTSKAYTEQVSQGFITRDRAAREISGTKYSQNVKKLKRENQALAEANEALVHLEKGEPEGPPEAPEQDDDGETNEPNAILAFSR